jgi:pyruvate dehydrogenase E2 component (dihydrolipoamide acetyltransferase)
MATLISMPRLSPTMEEGVVAKWLKQEGDKISPGDIVAEVETDKANMDFPLEDEGVLLKLLAAPGQTIKLGAPVAILGKKGEDITQLLKELGSASPEAPKPVAAAPTQAAAPTPVAAPTPAPVKSEVTAPAVQVVAATQARTGGRLNASPLARRLATEAGVDLRTLKGSGPGGRIVKRDIESAPKLAAQSLGLPASSPIATPTLLPGDELTPLSMIRRTAARRLVEAKQTVPHFYLTSEVDMEATMAFREQLNHASQASGGDKVSVNDLILKSLARALRLVPRANMSFSPDGQNAIVHHRVDVSVAVALDDGLITPVVRGADGKSLGAIAREVRELAQRGRDKKLRPEEYTGGTFSLTNLGMYGIREFYAIINPPESGILAVGQVEKRPVVVERDGKDQIEIRRRLTLTLSCDHRIVDGALGAQLLAKVVEGLREPMLLVL